MKELDNARFKRNFILKHNARQRIEILNDRIAIERFEIKRARKNISIFEKEIRDIREKLKFDLGFD